MLPDSIFGPHSLAISPRRRVADAGDIREGGSFALPACFVYGIFGKGSPTPPLVVVIQESVDVFGGTWLSWRLLGHSFVTVSFEFSADWVQLDFVWAKIAKGRE